MLKLFGWKPGLPSFLSMDNCLRQPSPWPPGPQPKGPRATTAHRPLQGPQPGLRPAGLWPSAWVGHTFPWSIGVRCWISQLPPRQFCLWVDVKLLLLRAILHFCCWCHSRKALYFYGALLGALVGNEVQLRMCGKPHIHSSAHAMKKRDVIWRETGVLEFHVQISCGETDGNPGEEWRMALRPMYQINQRKWIVTPHSCASYEFTVAV